MFGKDFCKTQWGFKRLSLFISFHFILFYFYFIYLFIHFLLNKLALTQ